MNNQNLNACQPGTNLASFCPLSGSQGVATRTISGKDLFGLYGTYMGQELGTEFFDLYFQAVFTEYFSRECGLRWYEPSTLGDGKYYEALASAFPWYYNPGSWDKQTVLDVVCKWPDSTIVEIGSGDGWLLENLERLGRQAVGVEINEKALSTCRANGLKVYLPGEPILSISANPILCLLQTIEHVADPLDFMRAHIHAYRPKHIILSAPCFESLLGYTSDPLSWPPHHATAWSEKAFQLLARLLEYKVTLVKYSPLTYSEFIARSSRESTGRIKGIPRILRGGPRGWVGRAQFKCYQLLRRHWACRSHSILVVLSRV